MEALDVIVVGGGQAGLSVSFLLCENQLSHIVFERGTIGESWHSQRWNSFAMNTPNCINMLPGNYFLSSDPDGFISGINFSNFLSEFAEKNNLPVNTNSKVISVEKNGEDLFLVTVKKNDRLQHYLSKQIVIASGGMSTFRIPGISKKLPKHIVQLHAGEYKNPSQLPEGTVLVVGGAQSGCQVAEDLARAGRNVYLSSSKVMRIPRRYRGKDITHWLTNMKFFDVLTDSVTDQRMLTAPPPQLSGINMNHTVSYQYLKSLGVRIFGHLNDIIYDELIFGADAKENVKFADESSMMVKSLIDEYILKSGINTPDNDPDEADMPDTECVCAEDTIHLRCSNENITSVIWCTGFTSDFSYIKLPVLTAQGKPIHRNGISPVKGLYFIGLPWLRSRKSAIIYGIVDDAKAIVNEISSQVMQT